MALLPMASSPIPIERDYLDAVCQFHGIKSCGCEDTTIIS